MQYFINQIVKVYKNMHTTDCGAIILEKRFCSRPYQDQSTYSIIWSYIILTMRQYNDRIYVTKIPNLYSAKDCQIHRIQTYLNNLHQKSYRICTLSYTGLKMSLIRHKHVIFQVIVFLGHFNYFVSKFMAKSKSGGFNRLVI